MKLLVVLLLFGCADFAGPAILHAQNTPFQNPSLDSNCYFPQIGVPGEIDTIYGSQANQGLGEFIHNLGPKPDGSFGNMLIGNISPSVALAQAVTGPNFNLHKLQATTLTLGGDRSSYRFGHFHDRSHLDILETHAQWRIYWADDNGNYDSSRYTNLASNIYESFDGKGLYTLFRPIMIPYIAKFTSDTVDDIVLEFYTSDSVDSKDSAYLALYKGGENLFDKPVAREDTSLLIGPLTSLSSYYSITLQGDFQGTGRDDLLIRDDTNNLLLFRNDPPFTLTKLLYAMRYDTLCERPPQLDSSYLFPTVGYYILDNALVMHALPKKQGDSSCDLLVWIPTVRDTNNGIFIFRGGPNFGSHRITIDSAAYVITPPQLGYSIWPEGLADAGDMTGTGNHVLYTGGLSGISGTGNYGDQNFYLTGQALDNKIDIFYLNSPAGAGDTLTSNDDSLEDILLGNPGYTSDQDRLLGRTDLGTMWLMYGSKQIPVHLNPKFADVKSIPQENGTALTFSPNPARLWSVATIVWPESEEGEYSIYDMLGRKIEEGAIQLYGGAEQQRIYFSGMPDGVYIYTIEGPHGSASARFVKLGGAGGSGGGTQLNIIQQMKQARDGGAMPSTAPFGLSN